MSVYTVCDYKFYVEYDSIVTEVFPLNFNETALVDEPEQGHIFYRRKFQGGLVFGGQKLLADFNYFRAIEQVDPCGEINFLILKDLDTYFEGYFSTSSGEWNLDDCTFIVTPLVNDQYRDLLDKGNIEYNILDPTTGLTPVDTIIDDGITVTTLHHNLLVWDVMTYLLAQVAPGSVLESDFLSDVTNPITKTTNRYNYLTITHKYDTKYPDSLNPMTMGMMSFNQFIGILRCMNLTWDYDGTIFTLEHVSHWPVEAGLDIRDQKSAWATNKYKYLKESTPKYERFLWLEAGYTDFIGAPIWYNSICVNQDSNSNTVEYPFDVTTDIEYILDCIADADSESVISDDGWVILANENRTGTYYVWANPGLLDLTVMRFNMDMSWSYLHRNFFKHDRQLINGNMNNSAITFYTAKKVKQQDCSIAWSNSFDPADYITTELGETYFGGEKASVQKAIIRPYGQIDLSLLYGPDDNVNPGITYGKLILITEVLSDPNETTYYAILNQAADIPLVIDIYLTISDSDLDDCDTAVFQINIAAGDSSGSVVIAWCNTMATPNPPYCVDNAHVTPPVGWTVYNIITDPNARC